MMHIFRSLYLFEIRLLRFYRTP